MSRVEIKPGIITEDIKIEEARRGAARMRVNRYIGEGEDRVRSTIKEELDARAYALGLDPQAYRNLLEHPDLYRKFLETRCSSHCF